MQTLVLKSLIYPLNKFLVVSKYGNKNKRSLINWISQIYITLTLALFVSLKAEFPSWNKFCLIMCKERSCRQAVCSNIVRGESHIFLPFWKDTNTEVKFLFFYIVVLRVTLLYILWMRLLKHFIFPDGKIILLVFA